MIMCLLMCISSSLLLTLLTLRLLMTSPVHDSAFLRVHLSLFLCLCSPQLLKHGSNAVVWEPGLLQVMEAVERKGLKELSKEAAQALRLLLTEVLNAHLRSLR